MNIDLAIEQLGKNNNFYRHDGSKITYWGKGDPSDSENPDAEPTQAELDAAWAQVETDRTANSYKESRANAYPTIGDQLDMLWHAVDTGDWTAAKVKTTEFYTALKAVKDANPKP